MIFYFKNQQVSHRGRAEALVWHVPTPTPPRALCSPPSQDGLHGNGHRNTGWMGKYHFVL